MSVRTLLAVVAFAVGCADPSGPAFDGFWSSSGQWSGRIVMASSADDARWPRDPVTITRTTIEGDSLTVEVTYGGGCGTHAFALVSDGAWMESSPVQVRLRLAHDDDNDACDALLSRTLRFDLTALRQAYESAYHSSSGAIRLRLDDAPTFPTWQF